MPTTLLAFVQFFFTLTWTVYVVYLPNLMDQAGIERRWVPVILMMDQAIFLACDWAAGVYADRIARTFGRVGGVMAAVTLVSCVAFLALPWIAPMAGKWVFLALTVVWSVTSSALRAPPLVLMGRHARSPSLSGTACAFLFGLGVANAIAPYLSIELRQYDPRIPFALASVGLAAFALALAHAERAGAPMANQEPEIFGPGRGLPIALLVFTFLLLAFGRQVHFAMNSQPQYLRLSTQDQLVRLMPVYWIGFSFALLPAMLLVKRYGGTAMMAVGALVGVPALYACANSPDLQFLVTAQTIAGIAWGFVSVAAFTAALEAGWPSREGFVTGLLFSTLAAAALARIGLMAGNLQPSARISAQLESLPFIAWGLAVFLLVLIAFPERRAPKPA